MRFLAFTSVYLVTLCLLSASPVSAAPLKACLKTDTGKIVIKRRCKTAKGQQEVNAELLQGLGASQVGPAGPQGPQGPKGDTGEKGDVGPSGTAGYQRAENSLVRDFSAFSDFALFASCPSGMNIVSWGCPTDGSFVDIDSSGTFVEGGNTRLRCQWENNEIIPENNVSISAIVECTDLTS